MDTTKEDIASVSNAVRAVHCSHFRIKAAPPTIPTWTDIWARTRKCLSYRVCRDTKALLHRKEFSSWKWFFHTAQMSIICKSNKRSPNSINAFNSLSDENFCEILRYRWIFIKISLFSFPPNLTFQASPQPPFFCRKTVSIEMNRLDLIYKTIIVLLMRVGPTISQS